MDLIIFEDGIKYDPSVKLLLVVPLLLLIALGVAFHIDAMGTDIFPRERPNESRVASLTLFGSMIFVLLVYALVLPRKIAVASEGIKIVSGAFAWNVSYRSMRSITAARGIFVWWGYSAITSYGSQIKILRKSGFEVRICPLHRDQFLDHANRALEDWRRVHGIA